MTLLPFPSPKRCPWCQLPLPRASARAARVHRCPAKPQTYLSDEMRPVPAPLVRRRRVSG